MKNEECERIERLTKDRIVSISPLGGGDICRVYRLNFERRGSAVVKISDTGGLDAEADGLKELRRPGVIDVPEVWASEKDILVMEEIPRASERAGFFEEFGRRLAALHEVKSERFGYRRDNRIGHLPQRNTSESSAAEFFRKHRLGFLVEYGRKRRRVSGELFAAVQKVCDRLEDWFAPIQEPPALLHGDLWSGNFLSGPRGPVLIDPAVYYGPREADLAMTRLFGGFPRRFYDAYEEAAPLPEGWSERVDLFNLYHLLTHTIMFGGGYERQALAAAKRYI
ncbi:MAG: fructosamine kinase [Candidatus Hydrogenedentota bacterium]|nr:MAG: fructosamine kinase [Candidatus Hydrogenedentota bacterium]